MRSSPRSWPASGRRRRAPSRSSSANRAPIARARGLPEGKDRTEQYQTINAQIAATVPEEYHLGDKALYVAAVQASKPAYSVTGIVPAAGMKSAYEMLVAFEDELKDVKVDLGKTFDDRFVKKAASSM